MRRVNGGLVLGMAFLGCAMGLGRGAAAAGTHANGGPGDTLRSVRSSNYQIETDVDQATIEQIGRHMDRIFREYSKRFSDYPVRNATALKLWVFENEIDYGTFLASVGINATGSGGMFFVGGKEAGLATFIGGRPLEVVLETLRHEGLHQFAHLRIHDSLPQWVNEGLAEYFGYSVETRTGIEPGVVDEGAISRLREAIEKDQVFSLDELLFMSNATWNARVTSGDARAIVMYDQSWSVVHFLMHAERGKYERLLWDFLRASWQGLSPEQASEKIFTRDLDAMDKAWREYVAELKPDPIVEARTRLGIFERALRELGEADQHPADLDEMAKMLRERGFAGTYTRGETERPLNGDPDSPGGWWMAFPESLRGRAAVIRFTPDRRGKAPPTVEVRGLRQPLRLMWKAERDGTLKSDITVG